MSDLYVIFAVIIAVSLLVSGVVYSSLRTKGKNPWPWSIATFVLSAVLIFGALFAVFLFNFER